VELKRYLLLDSAMGSLLSDVKKLKEILANDYGILNVPIGLLLVGFSHQERDEGIRRRLSSFVGRAGLGDWAHLERDFRIAPEHEPMSICLVDFWFFSGMLLELPQRSVSNPCYCFFQQYSFLGPCRVRAVHPPSSRSIGVSARMTHEAGSSVS
jgi:hypothetical protein